MKSMFVTHDHSEIVSRINHLTADSKPTWGVMTVGQMLRHCQFPIKTALKKDPPKEKPNFFTQLVFKFFKKSMYDDKPWKQNLPTPKVFRVTDERNFETEKNELLTLVNALYDDRKRIERPHHPSFGHFTYDQWGQMQYKHLDHHLRQFSV